MKIERPEDPTFFDHDFTAPWKKPITEESWQAFLKHNFDDPSRVEIYRFFDQYFRSLMGHTFQTKSFLEIGFGQAYDYFNFFKHYNDIGTITYTGWDVTKQFVEFAKKKEMTQDLPYRNQRFYQGSFEKLYDESIDILYTRHTFEHQHPDNCYKYLDRFLSKIGGLGVICWFRPPAKEDFSWNDRDGFNHEGAYVNVYDRGKVMDLIRSNGLDVEISVTTNPINHIYKLFKR